MARKRTSKKTGIPTWGVAAAAIAGLALGVPGGVFMAGGLNVNVGPQDVLDQCYRSDREAKAQILEELAKRDWPADDDTQLLETWKAKSDAARIEAFAPFIKKELAPTFHERKFAELAQKLRRVK